MKLLIKIGVLAHRDIQNTLQTWQKTADYLTSELPEYHFIIVPLNFTQIEAAIEHNTVEFVITSPGIYVEFEALYGVNRLATLKHLRMGKAYTMFGGVIFCKADCDNIQSLTDLRGKNFVAVAENSFGGWRSAWREIVEAGINPYRDFQSLHFTNSHDAVIYAIGQGKADAGTISTNVLEQMALEGKVDLKNFKIINQQTQYGEKFPFALSTRLYPEWPFAVTQQTSSELAEQVAIALLKLPKDHPAAIAAKSEGWTIPLNYQSIHDCFQVLQVHPYKDFGKISSSFELAVKGSNDGLWDWNLETNEVFFSTRWKEMLGYAETEIPNHFEEWKQRLHPDDSDRVLTTFRQYFEGQIPTYEQEYRLQHRNGNYLWVLCRGILVRDIGNKPYRIAGSHTDITRRKQAEEELRQSELQLKTQTQYLRQALKELQQTQMQLIHSEKMSSLGQLVAGIAHEINNPVNFIYGNLNCLEEYVEGLLNTVHIYQQSYPQPIDSVQMAMEKFELDFVSNDLPQLLNSMRFGSERIRDIVHSLRNFSRLDEAEIKSVDIHEGIENTLLILQHRLKLKSHKSTITLHKEYGNLPVVHCSPGQLNQVFMNILSNAIDALEETITHQPSNFIPTITIRTNVIDNHWVLIYIADNGLGMGEETKLRVFDPFFTTKPVGQGTGLGLSISYQIIVERHSGKLDLFSEPGKGTEFQIQLPLCRDLVT
ncbi:PhnD/SsuA/transferrin family substrate-binding protein [Anabaena cylindrica FACHB-243]|uniref:histidine kinase n=1 Tax=Anabaena cylindrica (strain ATCC 27899 / PCC 7122) TaxID=272123 RepID=K9ZEM3_ANACC|nr:MULTISPECIES: PhnD/SsuA/transferrin family substrate-binding protein [Anabaena]AFZ56805.1 PAS/PAC sensor signal transduction histidine kinase [Anabaena cylindrica PCC 7122]MBD2418601.1 PhnD/SsuA/transferrin family substrate-binding protein [Anabaena cylindrica FACHB-243]MBY5283613.1 PhnD/SsuA/transferrin family substrate-binding protein [Anabaena sp. CCAP 1446/1C]MBY5311287.1 PhnD/SsuA/transferrin family substrate-binding protein [Anabaena sp. CCAP 1446/1C]MCM2409346.1 PhnD/SsuA/transferrin